MRRKGEGTEGDWEIGQQRNFDAQVPVSYLENAEKQPTGRMVELRGPGKKWRLREKKSGNTRKIGAIRMRSRLAGWEKTARIRVGSRSSGLRGAQPRAQEHGEGNVALLGPSCGVGECDIREERIPCRQIRNRSEAMAMLGKRVSSCMRQLARMKLTESCT